MKRAQHTEHCRQILGEGFPQVHDYLDQHADTLGPKHRNILHNPDGVAYCINRWGYKAGAAACLHVWADEVGLIATFDNKFEPAEIIQPG